MEGLLSSMALPGRGLNEYIIIHMKETVPTLPPRKFNTRITPGLFSQNTAQLMSKWLKPHWFITTA